MDKPRIYADFQNADADGHLRLNCQGTMEDLARMGLVLREGMSVTLWVDDLDANGNPDELMADGTVFFSATDNCWLATVDWNALYHASEQPASHQNGASLAAISTSRKDAV